MNFQKAHIKNNFSQKCDQYNQDALVQKYAAAQLVDILITQIAKFKQNSSDQILDLGSGSSFIAKNLFAHNSNFKIQEIDLSAEMLKIYNNPHNPITKICGDFEDFPFAANSFDLILSSFSLQWCNNHQQLFTKIYQTLKPQGIFAFALPNSASFANLKNLPIHLNPLPDHAKLKTLLTSTSFDEKYSKIETFNQNYNNMIEALKSFKKIGTNYNKLTNISNYKHLKKIYLKNFKANANVKVDWSISYFFYLKNV